MSSRPRATERWAARSSSTTTPCTGTGGSTWRLFRRRRRGCRARRPAAPGRRFHADHLQGPLGRHLARVLADCRRAPRAGPARSAAAARGLSGDERDTDDPVHYVTDVAVPTEGRALGLSRSPVLTFARGEAHLASGDPTGAQEVATENGATRRRARRSRGSAAGSSRRSSSCRQRSTGWSTPTVSSCGRGARRAGRRRRATRVRPGTTRARGLPVAVKDEVEVAGQPCTEGSLILKDAVAARTAALSSGSSTPEASRTLGHARAAITDALLGRHANPVEPRVQPGAARRRPPPRSPPAWPSLATGSDIGGSIRCVVLLTAGCRRTRPSISTTTATTVRWRARSRTAACSSIMAGPHRDDIVSLRPKLTIGRTARRRGTEDRGERRPGRLRGAPPRSARTCVPRPTCSAPWGPPWTRKSPSPSNMATCATRPGRTSPPSSQPHPPLTGPAPRPDDDLRHRLRRGRRRAQRRLLPPLEIESEVYAQIADVVHDDDLLIAPVFGVPALKATAAEYDIEA